MDEEGPLSRDEAEALLSPWMRAAGSAGLVLAVSGGPDSTALMRLAAGMATPPCVRMTVATVDHGLRPESAAEAETVAAWAGECGLPHRILPWTGSKPRAGVQEAARQARYRLLAGCAAAASASHILIGHTLDDQAETIVMRLVRGSGIGGLAGMKVETGMDHFTLVRPFLGLRKSRLVATCRARGWPFIDDLSNVDRSFTRVGLRQEVMPVLARAGFTPERAAVLAARARRSQEAVEARAESVLAACLLDRDGACLELDGDRLMSEPEAVLLAAILQAVAAVAGPAGGAARLDRLERLVLGDLAPALAADMPLRRTLGGALIETRPGRRLRVAREGPRGKPLLRSS